MAVHHPVGVIPAVIALCFRLTIIGSPRNTAGIERDSEGAASELNSSTLLRRLQGLLLVQRKSSDFDHHIDVLVLYRLTVLIGMNSPDIISTI
ncbi:hypothetical protein EYC80_010297 [Monilinia laxa]|uniref:Uncharacterized protein n=1 Tax=Monilinia laxa TaxID=61186 RepID=A0A5N6JPT8_MONLA|nr:hypothetical protein EYC80_010297 [Monilinia laxa]